MTDIVILSKTALKEAADLIQADNPGLSVDEAYGRALDHMIAQLCEQDAIDPFEARILAELEQAERDTGGKPVPTTAIAVRLGVASRFTMYSYLRSLERRGLVHRPFGRKSKAGWRVAA